MEHVLMYKGIDNLLTLFFSCVLFLYAVYLIWFLYIHYVFSFRPSDVEFSEYRWSYQNL